MHQAGSDTEPAWTKQSLPRRLRGHALWNLANFVTTAVALFVVTAVAARVLPRQEFGVYVLLLTLVSLLPLLDLGLRTPVTVAGARAEGGDEEQGYHRALYASGLHAYRILALVSALPVLAVAAAILLTERSAGGVAPAPLAAAVLLAGSAAVLTVYTAAAIALATARSAFRRMALLSIAGQAANLCLVLLFIEQRGLVALSAGQLLNVLVAKCLLQRWVAHSTPWLPRKWNVPSRPEWRRLMSIGLPALLLTLSAQIITTTDVVLLSGIAGSAAVAAYRLGSVVPSQAIALLYRVVDVTFPVLAGMTDTARQERLVKQATTVAAVLAGTGLGMVLIFRDEVVRILVGGEDPLVTALLVVFVVIWAVNVPMHAWSLLLLARSRQKRLAPLVVTEAICNLALTLALVPNYGAMGAVLATLTTMALSNLVAQPLLLRNEFGAGFRFDFYLRGVLPLAATLTPAAVLAAASTAQALSGRLILTAALLSLQVSFAYFLLRPTSRGTRQ